MVRIFAHAYLHMYMDYLRYAFALLSIERMRTRMITCVICVIMAATLPLLCIAAPWYYALVCVCVCAHCCFCALLFLAVLCYYALLLFVLIVAIVHYYVLLCIAIMPYCDLCVYCFCDNFYAIFFMFISHHFHFCICSCLLHVFICMYFFMHVFMCMLFLICYYCFLLLISIWFV